MLEVSRMMGRRLGQMYGIDIPEIVDWLIVVWRKQSVCFFYLGGVFGVVDLLMIS